MTLLDQYRRVDAAAPCPVCGKPDWCMVSRDDPQNPAETICARIESPIRWGEAGWLHRSRRTDHHRTPARRVRVETVEPYRPDIARLAGLFRQKMDGSRLNTVADRLGITAASLRRLGVGWADWFDAVAFPMFDGCGRVRGIRLRRSDGRKWSVRGGKDGLFIPADWIGGPTGAHANGAAPPEIRRTIPGPLLICEGPTDTAAMLDLGYSAVGRPNCRGGMQFTVDLCRGIGIESVIVIADNDEPGRRGAEALVSVLSVYVQMVRLIAPPPGFKDIRDWKRAGATSNDIQTAIDAAPIRRLASKETK